MKNTKASKHTCSGGHPPHATGNHPPDISKITKGASRRPKAVKGAHGIPKVDKLTPGDTADDEMKQQSKVGAKGTRPFAPAKRAAKRKR